MSRDQSTNTAPIRQGGCEPSASGRVCPWRHAYWFDNLFRRLLHNPRKILGPFVKEGMRVMDVGCGMGFFVLAMARMVGDRGEVIAVDLQQEMLDVMLKRAERQGLAARIRPHRCEAGRLGVEDRLDFVLAFWMVHEVPDARAFAAQVHACLKPGGKLFVAEPPMHVSREELEESIGKIRSAGFNEHSRPRVRLCRSVVLERL